MLVLGIETSCDDTAVAVVAHGTDVRSSIVSSQDPIHAPYGGVVPELACRSHVENLVEHRPGSSSREGQLPRRHLVKNRSEREQVRSSV